MKPLPDIQSDPDERNIPINKVGVSDLRYPISVLDKNNVAQHTIANINMFVDLPHDYRGTHMSRFIEVISRHSVNLRLDNLRKILDDMKDTFDCERSHIELEFPYFIEKKAPVSGLSALMEYHCRIEATKNDRFQLIVEVDVPVHNLCPCSRDISEVGAHNQRGKIKIRIRSAKLIWFEELIAYAEESASAPLYSILKREDEKWVTEHAYHNPRFVEDTAREVALRLNDDSRVEGYSIEVTNFESIHNHNAYACINRW